MIVRKSFELEIIYLKSAKKNGIINTWTECLS